MMLVFWRETVTARHMRHYSELDNNQSLLGIAECTVDRCNADASTRTQRKHANPKGNTVSDNTASSSY